jgi:hypothetical protein
MESAASEMESAAALAAALVAASETESAALASATGSARRAGSIGFRLAVFDILLHPRSFALACRRTASGRGRSPCGHLRNSRHVHNIEHSDPEKKKKKKKEEEKNVLLANFAFFFFFFLTVIDWQPVVFTGTIDGSYEYGHDDIN